MPLNIPIIPENYRKYVFIGCGILFLACLGLIIYCIVSRFTSSSSGGGSVSGNVTVTGTAKGPLGSASITPFTTKGTTLQGQAVDDFIIDTLQNILSYNLDKIDWISVSLNNIDVKITNGNIDNSLPLIQFFGKIPSTINIYAVYHHNCTDEDKKIVGKTCNPCNGEAPVCSVIGWVCQPGIACPTGPTALNCCSDSPTGPVPVCKNNKIECSQCSETPPECESNCDGNGPVCTATGWICADFTVCATGAIAESCCKNYPGTFPTCDPNTKKTLCTTCKGEPPACPESCDGHGLVCKSDGTWACEPGISCPTGPIISTCCKDPNNPVFMCSTGPFCTKCGNCDLLPKKECPQTCLGNGNLCTSSGWQCENGVECATDPDVLSTCCTLANTSPLCDHDSTGKQCTQCVCNTGFYGCGGTGVCGDTVPSPAICCPESAGGYCSQNSEGHWGCCPPGQFCYVNGADICCPENTMCKDNDCVPVCGKNPDGSPRGCNPGQECLIISGASSSEQQKLAAQGAYIAPDGEAFLCKDPSTCTMGYEDSVPFSTDGYYPCLPLPQNRTADGLGYCSSSTEANIPKCFLNNNAADCEKDKLGCQWIDILPYVGATGVAGIQKISNDLSSVDPDSPNGYYCDTSNNSTPYQRVVMFPGANSDGCTWQDCWSHLAQPGITDIYYDENTGNCVGLASCNSVAGAGLDSKMINKFGILGPNTETQQLPTNSAFPPCSSASCPVGTNQGNFMCGPNGTVQRKSYSCVSQPDGTSDCELVNTGKGLFQTPTCDNSCPCTVGFQRGSDNNCYKIGWYNPATIGDGGVDAGCYAGSQFQSDSDDCHGDQNLDACSPDGDSRKQGWTGNCWQAGNWCYCSCILSAHIPKGYYYCDYQSAWDGQPAWRQCTTEGGCEGETVQPPNFDKPYTNQWGAIQGNNNQFGDDCTAGNYYKYCPIP